MRLSSAKLVNLRQSNVQEAVARYYHEKRPDAEDLYLKSKLGGERTKTEMLLAPEFWQGQQDFNSKSEVHARHMRPLCDVISTSRSTSIGCLDPKLI